MPFETRAETFLQTCSLALSITQIALVGGWLFLSHGRGLTLPWQGRASSTPVSLSGLQLFGIRSPEVHGTINGIPVAALPDSGSSVNIVSAAFARRNHFEIDESEPLAIPLLGGCVAKSIGRIFVDFRFKGERRKYLEEFHVLQRSSHDVILGKSFLEYTETLTKYSDRILYDVRSCIRRGNRLFLMDQAPRERIRCSVNGSTASALPDTGSDLMLISGDFARRNGFEISRGEQFRTDVELINGSIIRTDGTVLDAELHFDILPSCHELGWDQYHAYIFELSSKTAQNGKSYEPGTTFICDLHVVENLPCDIVLSSDFVLQNNVFSRFQSLFYTETTSPSEAHTTSVDCGLMFVRRRGEKRSWFSRRRERGNNNELDTSKPSNPVHIPAKGK
ncbi:hypothetical protein NLG97_g8371 [Lecanicillium saksenae]|uniref:Uncharacterized protein n=1 Tax=Lecanicillium saksenae TaxID=468837 RepID=A0ACC1QLR9_9HYPO|nr:hypothetical protein NLG97_g8371 [Lecanicillium saksenae]